MKTDELIRKAKAGCISANEIKFAYDSLVNGTGGDKYTWLLIIGRANATEYKEIVERYLYCPEDPMMSRLALQILCQYWVLSSDYIKYLCEFIAGVDWDDEEDVRIMALSCSGEVFKHSNEPELLKYVYDVFIDPQEDDLCKSSAYESLAILYGEDLASLPGPMHFDIEKDVKSEVVDNAKNILEQHHLL